MFRAVIYYCYTNKISCDINHLQLTMEVFRWFYVSSAFADRKRVFFFSPQQTNDQPIAADPAEFLNDGQIPFCFEPRWERTQTPTSRLLPIMWLSFVVVWLCISSTAHPHRLHTDAVLLPFTLLLLQHQLIHTQTHFVFLIQPLFLYFYWPFLTQFNFSISQWGAEALSAVWSDLSSSLRPVQVWGARGEPLEDLPLVRRTVPSRLRPGALREARPHPLRQ